MIRGQIYSLCLIPSETAGGQGLLITTFSGLCAPGPGFFVASGKQRKVRKKTYVKTQCILKTMLSQMSGISSILASESLT